MVPHQVVGDDDALDRSNDRKSAESRDKENATGSPSHIRVPAVELELEATDSVENSGENVPDANKAECWGFVRSSHILSDGAPS